MTGSIRVARRAGSHAATSATSSSVTATATYTSGSPGFDLEQHLPHQPRDEKRPDDAETYPEQREAASLPSTIRITVRGEAPRAMRMPISLVRNATRCAITL